MGHSEASLYKNASIGWPFTYGSGGRCSSRGTISGCVVFLKEVVSDATVFDRGRKGVED
jgi:hypothetical protein